MTSTADFTDLNAIFPSRVVIAGDWHRHYKAHHAIQVIKYAHKIGADGIIHVGDLGYNFNHHTNTDNENFEKPLREALEKFDMFMVWVDGNHDNHEWLQNLPIREDGFVQTDIDGRIFWAPRAHRWEWFGIRFASMGGAYSINEHKLTEGVNLYKKLEEVKESDVNKLGNGKVDVLLTHDVPYGVPVYEQVKISRHTYSKAVKSRFLLREAVENTKPEHVFSGHWHQKLDYDLTRNVDGITTCHVLDREYSKDNIVILDLHDFTVTNPPVNWNHRTYDIF